MTTKKERREALARMTKAELIKTIVALDKRQTTLLNEVAELQRIRSLQVDLLQSAPTARTTYVVSNDPAQPTTDAFDVLKGGQHDPETSNATPLPPAFPWVT